MRRILFIVNDLNFFISHRLPIAVKAKDQGFDVYIASGTVGIDDIIKQHKFTHYKIPLTRSGTGILNEIKLFISLYKLMKILKPDLIHLITIKPVIYGGIVSKILNIKAAVFAIPGLGFTFIKNSFKYRVLRAVLITLYKIALSHKNSVVIFQNKDDRELFIRKKIVASSKTEIINGSGVNLKNYNPILDNNKACVVTFAARLLKDKGINEFIEAANIIRKKESSTEFWILGDIDKGNPASLNEDELEKIKKLSFVKYYGHSNDIADIFQKSSMIVLPSYREGLPKVLIEAAACGRAVITTDVPGCRDAIIPNETGLLVPIKNGHMLAEKIQFLINNPVIRNNMGKAGRRLAESKFDINSVVDKHITFYKNLLQ